MDIIKEANNANLFDNPLDLGSKPNLTAVLPPITPTGKENTIAEPTVEVRFCTGGRLSAPPILHFRDYSMLASQELAELPAAKDHLPVIVRILNSMVVEDFDCGLLHMEEAKEVLLNVYGKWWGNKLSGFRYLLDPDIADRDKLLAKENISEADIPMDALVVEPLNPEIKEPINIKAHGITVKFIYPRIRNSGIVDDLLKIRFAVQEQQFHRLKQILEFNSKQADPESKKEINLQEAEEYDTYLAERAKWRLIYMRAQEICGIDDVVLETLDARIKALTEETKISVRHWQLFTEFLEGKGKFGLKNEAEFYSDILNQRVRRPFLFYTWNLIPSGTMERTGDVDDSISFG
jgi:hypothetical protein